jgi:WD40 repeat protein
LLTSANSEECDDLDDDAGYNGDREVCKIKLWNALDGKLIASFDQFDVSVHSLAFSSDGKNIVSGHDYGYIHVWNVMTEKLSQSIKGNWGGIRAVTFRPKDDMVFVTGSNRGHLKLWTLKEQTDSNYYGVKADNFTAIDNLFIDKKYSFSSVAMSSDGKKIVSRFSNNEDRFEKGILLIDIDKRRVLWRKNIATHSSYGDSLAFSPDDKKVIYAYNYGLILLDATTGEKQKIFEHADTSGSVTTVAFSPDGKTIVSGDASGRITLWDVETGNIRVMVANDSRERKGSVQSLVLSPDGKTMTSALQGNINQWDFDCVNQN